MYDDITLIGLDNNIDESRWVKKGERAIECFDYMGQFWPLHLGKKYLVKFELEQLDFALAEFIPETDGKIEQVGITFAHYLYGYVENNVFIAGDFKFDFEKFNDDRYYNRYLKFLADRINVTFFKELPD